MIASILRLRSYLFSLLKHTLAGPKIIKIKFRLLVNYFQNLLPF